MRHFHFLVLALAGVAALAFSSCVKAPELTITGPSSIEVSADGSSSSITFTANRDWTVRSANSWVTISPSFGAASDGPVTVNISCAGNTTYEDRTATITISIDGQSQTITVTQPANLGVVFPTRSYDLTSDSRSLDVEVQANVQYSVIISEKWIKQTGTKGLTTNKLTFSIEENDTYDGRSATITIKPQNALVQEQVITVKQAQKDALIVKDTKFDMPFGGGEIEFKVEANVSFDVSPSVDWIHYVETKALSSSTVRLTVDENETYSSREGKIEIKQKNGSLSHTITVKQAGRIAVSSIALNKTSIRLKEGESETLVATVKPDNATDKTVTWTSSNSSVATVDESGKVTAVKIGTADITAKTGEKTAKCTVTVYKDIPVSSISLDKTTLSLTIGEVVFLTATVQPDNATDKTVTWSSSNANIAAVDNNGKVTAVSEGTATISVKAGEKTAACEVNVSKNTNIKFADKNLKQCLVAKFDTNGDGELSYEEAAAVSDFSDAIDVKTITSFDEFQYFTGLKEVPLFCFASFPYLSSIILPPTISSIAEKAFFQCASLSSITIPDSVTSISRYSFSECTNLTSVKLPNGIEELESNVFSYCNSLSSITIPNSVKSIGVAAFGRCISLTSVNLPNGLTSIDGAAFIGCTSLSSIVIPDTVGYIGEYAFNGCSSLTSITLPSGIENINSVTFMGCTSLAFISIPSSVTTIGENAFRHCTSLSSITFPDSVTKIGDYAFYQCTSLTSITIPQTVASVGNQAFNSCSSLTSVTISDGVSQIGGTAFANCTNLKSIIIPNSIKYLSGSIFYNCERLSTVTLPEGLTTIGDGAFTLCASLTSIIIPDSVTDIERNAFSYCTNLKSITIPVNVKNIGNSVFYECTKLSYVRVDPINPPKLGGNSAFAGTYPIYVPDSSLEAYKNASVWKTFEDRIHLVNDL